MRPAPLPALGRSQKQNPELWSSRDPAVGGGDHPVLADEGAPAEVEAGAVLQEDGEGQRALDSSSTGRGSGHSAQLSPGASASF